jgi:Ca2+/Na+ antiporter
MMGLVTGALGAFLSLVGLFCFIASEPHALQALLPTGFGVVFLLLAFLARFEKRQTQAVQAAALLSLVALALSAGGGLSAMGKYLFGAVVPGPMVALSQFLTTLACAAYLIFSVQVLFEAYKERQAEEERPKSRARTRVR